MWLLAFFIFYMPRCRRVRRDRRNPYPLRNRQGRGQVQHQKVEPRALEHDVEAREMEHEVEARAVEAPQQHENMTNTVAVRAGRQSCHKW